MTDVFKKTDKLSFLLIYTSMRRTNRIVDIFKLGSIGKVRMWSRARWTGGDLAKSVIYCFNDASFSQSAYKGDSELKKNWLISA